MADHLRESMLLCLGNPLLDISITESEELLEKYDLKPNDAILASEQHKPLYDELIRKYNPDYIAGGSAQNTSRIIQMILKKPNVVVYMGCVGYDKYSEILEAKAKDAGVNVRYQYTCKDQTGTCAVLVSNNGKNRSLCASLAAANHFTVDHVRIPENMKYINQALYFYVAGFFLTVSLESLLEVADISLKKNRTFVMNLSAPFICRDNRLTEALPYVDILFGNRAEAEEFAEVMNYGTKDLKKIAFKIADYPKKNPDKKRVVIITHSENPVILVTDGTIRSFPVDPIQSDKIVDTNGAGDAFAAGFLSQLLLEQPFDVCIKCGNWAASQVIQNSGCILNNDAVFSQ